MLRRKKSRGETYFYRGQGVFQTHALPAALLRRRAVKRQQPRKTHLQTFWPHQAHAENNTFLLRIRAGGEELQTQQVTAKSIPHIIGSLFLI